MDTKSKVKKKNMKYKSPGIYYIDESTIIYQPRNIERETL